MIASRSIPVLCVAAGLIGSATLSGCASKQPQPDPQALIMQQQAEKDRLERLAIEKTRRAAEEEAMRAQGVRRAADQLLQEAAAAEEKARQEREKTRRAEKLQLIIK
ncbi:MAG: hypothetical protein HQL64_06615 [Magnetococcales bacterium]|nr:hypothetical protein [Magnetococcales bacterium]